MGQNAAIDLTRVGIAFTPFETRADVIVRLAVRADELGLGRVDLAEGWTHDATVLLAELALRTSAIELGTAVLSAWGRTPATMALGACTLQRVSRGRFTLGLGASSPPLTEGFHGVAWDRPIGRLRDTLTTIRALLGGERHPHPAPNARALRLGAAPAEPVPIALAALSTASIRLAGELADVWAPFLWARSHLEDGADLLREGESRSQKATPTRVSVGVPVALAADEREARRLASWWLATYATRMGPLYPRMLAERFGMASAVESVVAAAQENPAPELPSAAEELAREVTMLGRYDEAAEHLDAWFAAGADTVQLVLPPGRPEQELTEIVESAAHRSTREPALPVR